MKNPFKSSTSQKRTGLERIRLQFRSSHGEDWIVREEGIQEEERQLSLGEGVEFCLKMLGVEWRTFGDLAKRCRAIRVFIFIFLNKCFALLAISRILFLFF